MIKSIKMVCVDWLSREKVIELNQDQIKALNQENTVKENLERFKNACRYYSKNYWVTGYVNNHKFCWFQWSEV